MPIEEATPLSEASAPISAPVAAPIASVSEPLTQAPVVAPVAENSSPAPIAEPVAPQATPTVLSQAPVSIEEANDNSQAQTTESPKTEDITDTKTEGDKSDEPASLPTYEPFPVPEGIALNQEALGGFYKKLGEFELKSKADHAAVQEFGHSLLTEYVADIKNVAETLNGQQKQALEQRKGEWLTAFKQDPEIGGPRQQTTVKAALEFIETNGGNQDQKTTLRKMLDETGLGNHPDFIRLLANAQRSNPEGRLLAANRPVAAKKGLLQKMYGTA